MKTSPARSTATPVGWSRSLAVAGNPSPLNPAVPVPATVTRYGDVARWSLRPPCISCTRWAVASATKTSPLESTASAGRVAHGMGAGAGAAGQDGDMAGLNGEPVDLAAAGGKNQDPAMARVGDEEVAGRIQGEAAWRVECRRAEQRPHAGRRGVRPRRPAEDDRHQQRRPAQHRDEGAPHPLIMPVAIGVRPESRAIVGGAAETRRTNERKGGQPWQHPKKPSRPRT